MLDAQKSEETVFTLQWTEPDMGYQAATTNYVQMALAGNDFTNATIIASVGKGGQLALTHNSLNNSIARIGDNSHIKGAADPMPVRQLQMQELEIRPPKVPKNTLSGN